ncbi:carbon-nitrogen family hydrolase [[Clostridium] polysaccharolyticum]|uniref:Carbon-nitrogen hydrolase n=1 Tax=[Clostridium] polysaccharolyticum TaxID=29364 RepID=A0A1I0CUJ9_9FIRM|nr:carbon-nitrogen family hydrolase [[Clostridium] polysaccharolyticum]SET23503.1 Carbon-nitrogen hydrolase [[Clostridium] polysaccharolyticum]
MRIGIVQMQILWENKEKNKEKILLFLTQAQKEKIDLVLLPEMSLTGFSMEVCKTKDSYAGQTIEWFQKICRNRKLAIGFGWVEKNEQEKALNHYSIVDKQGNLISDYVKIHPFRYGKESEYFQGGNNIVCCNLLEHKIATVICYDLRFPELFRIQDKDCSVIIVPANWPASRSSHWKCLLQARAIENQVYIIGINCCGMMDGSYYSGDSSVFSPVGERLLQVGDKETMAWIEINNDVKEYQSKFPVRMDQRIQIKQEF